MGRKATAKAEKPQPLQAPPVEAFIDGKMFGDALGRVLPAAAGTGSQWDTDQSEHVQVKLGPKGMQLVATDGHRTAIAIVPAYVTGKEATLLVRSRPEPYQPILRQAQAIERDPRRYPYRGAHDQPKPTVSVRFEGLRQKVRWTATLSGVARDYERTVVATAGEAIEALLVDLRSAQAQAEVLLKQAPKIDAGFNEQRSKALSEMGRPLQSLIRRSGQAVHLIVTPGADGEKPQCSIFGEVTVTRRLDRSAFPNWAAKVPKKGLAHRVTVPVAALRQAAAQAKDADRYRPSQYDRHALGVGLVVDADGVALEWSEAGEEVTYRYWDTCRVCDGTGRQVDYDGDDGATVECRRCSTEKPGYRLITKQAPAVQIVRVPIAPAEVAVGGDGAYGFNPKHLLEAAQAMRGEVCVVEWGDTGPAMFSAARKETVAYRHVIHKAAAFRLQLPEGVEIVPKKAKQTSN